MLLLFVLSWWADLCDGLCSCCGCLICHCAVIISLFDVSVRAVESGVVDSLFLLLLLPLLFLFLSSGVIVCFGVLVLPL